jgi:hypothetical protein
MIDNLSNLDKTGRCWIVLFRITGSLVAVCQKASSLCYTSFSSFFLFFFFFFPTTLRGRCFWVLVCTMGGVECPFCCCMRGGAQTYISPSALLISTSFSQNWCLSCCPQLCVNQGSKQKNQSKLKTNDTH